MTWFGILLFACGCAARRLADRRALSLTDPTRAVAYRRRRAPMALRAAIRALRWTAHLAIALGLVLMAVGVIADPDAPPSPRPARGATESVAVHAPQPR
ncbi:MAG: hypothetical protein ICV73_04715 [Acetobacteraceae bacterium]|nr:hypothetical protein [Acetobacteraceae bacterium]